MVLSVTAEKKPKAVIQKNATTTTTISAVQLRSQMQTETYSIASLTEPMENLPEFMMQMENRQRIRLRSYRQKTSASCIMEDMA